MLTTYAATLALLSPADDVHIYGIDLVGRSLAQLAELPHCGGVAVRNEQLALRIVRWLVQVAAERRIEVARTGSANVWEHATVTGELPPQLVLLVSGADRLLTTAEGATSHLLGPLTRLMGEAIGVRIQVVLAGLPKIASHRLGMNVERRLVLQTADVNDLAIVGVEPLVRRRAAHRAAGGRPAGRPRRATRPAGAGRSTGGSGDPLARRVAGTARPATAATLRRRHVAVVVGARGRRPADTTVPLRRPAAGGDRHRVRRVGVGRRDRRRSGVRGRRAAEERPQLDARGAGQARPRAGVGGAQRVVVASFAAGRE